MSELATLLHKIWIGAKVADVPAEDDYRQYFEEFTDGNRKVADHIADEVQVLQAYGEHDLARELIISAVHDTQRAEAAEARAAQAEAERDEARREVERLNRFLTTIVNIGDEKKHAAFDGERHREMRHCAVQALNTKKESYEP